MILWFPTKNPAYMVPYCPKSCGKCPGDVERITYGLAYCNVCLDLSGHVTVMTHDVVQRYNTVSKRLLCSQGVIHALTHSLAQCLLMLLPSALDYLVGDGGSRNGFTCSQCCLVPFADFNITHRIRGYAKQIYCCWCKWVHYIAPDMSQPSTMLLVSVNPSHDFLIWGTSLHYSWCKQVIRGWAYGSLFSCTSPCSL